jgi:hypothetical protein
MFVTDAVGGRSQAAHRTAIERLSHAGAVLTTALAVVTEADDFTELTGRATAWKRRARSARLHRDEDLLSRPVLLLSLPLLSPGACAECGEDYVCCLLRSVGR